MIATLRECPVKGHIQLDTEFQKDIKWFQQYLACTNGVFIMDEDSSKPVHMYIDACQAEAYHAEFPHQVLQEQCPICEL